VRSGDTSRRSQTPRRQLSRIPWRHLVALAPLAMRLPKGLAPPRAASGTPMASPAVPDPVWAAWP